jgi:sulfotransferase
MSKQYYYLVGLPRSGNTLLASILNQNPEVSVTANSIFPSILWALHKEKENNLLFLNFPDHESYDNMLKGLIDSYYKNWPSSVIIDRAAWGSKNNVMLIEKYCPNKPKFVVLVRPILEVLASFIKWSTENPHNFLNTETNNGTIEEKCDFLMRPDLQIIQEYASIHNLYSNQDKYEVLFIDYTDLVKNAPNEIQKIYTFLDLPQFEHKFTDIDQFEVNKVKYDDSVVGNSLHTIKTKAIEKTKYDVIDYLPKSVIEKYSGLDFWEKPTQDGEQ